MCISVKRHDIPPSVPGVIGVAGYQGYEASR